MIFPDAGMIISHKQSKKEHQAVADIWEVGSKGFYSI